MHDSVSFQTTLTLTHTSATSITQQQTTKTSSLNELLEGLFKFHRPWFGSRSAHDPVSLRATAGVRTAGAPPTPELSAPRVWTIRAPP